MSYDLSKRKGVVTFVLQCVTYQYVLDWRIGSYAGGRHFLAK